MSESKLEYCRLFRAGLPVHQVLSQLGTPQSTYYRCALSAAGDPGYTIGHR
jgi:hypothetical protein